MKWNVFPPAVVGDKYYLHDQQVPSATWNIAHNLGKRPAVVTADSSGRVVMGNVQYIDDNNLTVTFSAGFAGKAYLN